MPQAITFRRGVDSERRSRRQPMGVRSRFFAVTYDRFSKGMEDAGLAEMRRNLIEGASGDVLEIGGGTGANLSYYGAGVESLTVTEPERPMLKRLERKARERNSRATILRAPAEDLPFEDASFDTVVSTLVLCGVDDQPRAVRELRRVLRPGGRLIFIEHVRSDDPQTAKMQDRMNPLNRFVVCCDCNRPTLDTVRSAGFDVTELQQTELPKSPPFGRPLIIGTATAPAA
jgi:ubiquinone/menaquinone biosynthesis C-methylase UbiE